MYSRHIDDVLTSVSNGPVMGNIFQNIMAKILVLVAINRYTICTGPDSCPM